MEIFDIKQKAIVASKWSFIEKASLQIVQFFVGIVLARLLGPQAFGLMALTYIFIAISGAITDGGFEKALIQNQELSVLQINTAFYINILLGFAMTLIIFVIAPFISNFFNAPELTDVLRVLSLGLPIDAFGQTQRMLLMRELNFKKISIGQVCSAIVSGIVGITLAFCGLGVWALVYSSLAGTLTWVLVFWYKSVWYPKFLFSYSSISRMVPFGLNVLASSILLFFSQQFNTFIVGKYYSKTEVGLFNRGMKFPEMISSIVQGVILKMSFPLFAKLQHNEFQLKNAMCKSTRMVAFTVFPLLAFMFINAKEIIIFLLTDKWIGAIIFLKMFCLVNLFTPFISLQRELLLAKGKAKLLFRFFILTSAIEIVPILLLVKYEIIYILWVSLASKMLQFYLYNLLISRKVGISVKESIKWTMPYWLIIFFTTATILLMNLLVPFGTNNLLKLSTDLLIGGSLYIFIVFSLKLQELSILRSIVVSFLKKRS